MSEDLPQPPCRIGPWPPDFAADAPASRAGRKPPSDALFFAALALAVLPPLGFSAFLLFLMLLGG